MSKLILFIVLTLFSVTGFAQEQSHTDAARELLDLMNADYSIQQTYDQMYIQMSGMADQMGITEDQRPMFESYLEKMVVVMKDEFSWEKLEPHILKAYVTVYTEEELRELGKFYASPLGQKFVAKMPELMQATMQMTQELIEDLMPRIAEIQKELQAEVTNGIAEPH